MGISIKSRGNFNNLDHFLKTMKKGQTIDFDRYGAIGVSALAAATPIKTGKTASSWTYDVTEENGKTTISWSNTNINNGVNIAVILQYGHGTNNGGFVQGRDYINPAMQSVFDQIAEDAWNEVCSE